MPKPTASLLITRRRLLAGIALGGALVGCNTSQPAVGRSRLQWLAEARLPHRLAFQGTVVGGLSGIDYDAARREYVLLSDDRSDLDPARFYTANWALDGTPKLTGVASLRQADGATWPNRRQANRGVPVPDPEALRWRPDTDTLLWTSEGDLARGFGPALYESRRDGGLIRQIALPAMFAPDPDGVFAGVIDVFGDGSVWALSLPGHSPGSTGYLINAVDGPKLVTGDAVSTRLGWEQGMPQLLPASARAAAQASADALHRFATAHPGVEIFLGHQ